MKTTIRVIAAAAMLAVASTPAFAQGGGGGGGQQMSMAERQAAMRAAMFEGITLTDAQKAKLDTIDANTMKAQQEMRASMGDQPDRAVMAQKRQEITTDQVKLFEANLAKMPQGRGRGGR